MIVANSVKTGTPTARSRHGWEGDHVRYAPSRAGDCCIAIGQPT